MRQYLLLAVYFKMLSLEKSGILHTRGSCSWPSDFDRLRRDYLYCKIILIDTTRENFKKKNFFSNLLHLVQLVQQEWNQQEKKNTFPLSFWNVLVRMVQNHGSFCFVCLLFTNWAYQKSIVISRNHKRTRYGGPVVFISQLVIPNMCWSIFQHSVLIYNYTVA